MADVFNISWQTENALDYRFAQICRFLRDQAGWAIPLSGVGGSGPTGDNLGSGNMNTNTDWVCMESPDGARQFILDRATSNYGGTIYYSPAGLFTGGTPTSRATASDEVTVKSSPYNSIGGDYATIALYADDEPPYGWYAVGWENPTISTSLEIKIVFDPLMTGTYYPGDPDPYIWIVGHTSSAAGDFSAFSMYNESETTSDPGRCVGTLGSFSGTIPALVYSGSISPIVPGQGPADPVTREDYYWPIFYARRTGLNYAGYKGVGTLTRWNGRNHDFIAVTQNGERLIVDDVNLPWDGSLLVFQ